MLMMKKKHDAIVAGWADDLRATHNRLVDERDAETKRANELAAELAGAGADRDRYRNLCAASEKRRNEIGAELDHWRQYGQLRDPATGRLIPKGPAAAKRKAKGGVVLPDGLREQNGVIGFDCRVCDAFTEWNGETADFEHGAHENVCGGSPRCCP